MTTACCTVTMDHLALLRDALGRTISPGDLDTVDRAVATMLLCHRRQQRPGGAAYSQHPAEVALNVARWARPVEVELIVAALLHDTIEDQARELCRLGGHPALTRREAKRLGPAVLEELFGARVAALVVSLTNEDGPAETKNARYIEHVQDLALNHPDAFTIKLADFWTNALRLGDVDELGKRRSLISKYRPVMEFVLTMLRTAPPPRLQGQAPSLAGELETAIAGLAALESP